MAKDILLVVCGVVLSFVMLAAGAWITVQVTPLGKAINKYGSLWYESGDPFQLMNETRLVFYFVLFPLISLAIGVFVAMFTRNRAWLLAMISLVPVLGLFLLGNSWSLTAAALSIGYVLLSATTSQAMVRYRDRKLVA